MALPSSSATWSWYHDGCGCIQVEAPARDNVYLQDSDDDTHIDTPHRDDNVYLMDTIDDADASLQPLVDTSHSVVDTSEVKPDTSHSVVDTSEVKPTHTSVFPFLGLKPVTEALEDKLTVDDCDADAVAKMDVEMASSSSTIEPLDGKLTVDDCDFDAVAKMDAEMANKIVSVDTVDYMIKKMKEQAPPIGVVNPPSRPGEGKVKKGQI